MKHLKTYKLFEELNFDFDEEELKEIEEEKMISVDKKLIFINFEKECLEKFGFSYVDHENAAIKKFFVDDQSKNGYIIYFYKYKESIVPFYYLNLFSTSDKSSVYIKTKIEGGEKERIRLIRGLIKKLYVTMWSKGLDPESLKKKEEMKMKMKDIDPYGEEKWEEES